MAKYGISSEGAEALRQLSNDMNSLNNDIEQCGTTLSSTVSGLSDGLGVYEEQIQEVIAKVNSTQEKGRESVQSLSAKIKKLAEDVDALVNAGL